ncbi:hypothetical protein I4U23_020262 [Adineta vaga]|nr:hypothetical protein I4U23_020262 [Adineta vaga]
MNREKETIDYNSDSIRIIDTDKTDGAIKTQGDLRKVANVAKLFNESIVEVIERAIMINHLQLNPNEGPIEHYTFAASEEFDTRSTAIGFSPIDTSFFYGQAIDKLTAYNET